MSGSHRTECPPYTRLLPLLLLLPLAAACSSDSTTSTPLTPSTPFREIIDRAAPHAN